MTDRFRLTISQLNPTLGNFKENFSKAVSSWQRGKAEKANLVALPEMFITGYQTQDLVLRVSDSGSSLKGSLCKRSRTNNNQTSSTLF